VTSKQLNVEALLLNAKPIWFDQTRHFWKSNFGWPWIEN